jgi:hypothetical protein
VFHGFNQSFELNSGIIHSKSPRLQSFQILMYLPLKIIFPYRSTLNNLCQMKVSLRRTRKKKERFHKKQCCRCIYDILFSLSLFRIRPIGLFQFRIISEIMNHRQTVGLLGRVISSPEGLYLHRATQHRQTRTNIHAWRGIRTRDPVYERSRPAPQTARPLDRLIFYLFVVI